MPYVPAFWGKKQRGRPREEGKRGVQSHSQHNEKPVRTIKSPRERTGHGLFLHIHCTLTLSPSRNKREEAKSSRPYVGEGTKCVPSSLFWLLQRPGNAFRIHKQAHITLHTSMPLYICVYNVWVAATWRVLLPYEPLQPFCALPLTSTWLKRRRPRRHTRTSAVIRGLDPNPPGYHVQTFYVGRALGRTRALKQKAACMDSTNRSARRGNGLSCLVLFL